MKLSPVLRWSVSLLRYCYLLVFFTACKGGQQVSLIIHNAVIYTADSAFSVQQAMAINNGKIAALGTNENILREYEATETIDAAGKFIYPGLIDAHCHFTGYATDMWKCDLTGTGSFEDVMDAVKNYAANVKTDWLYGRGWDQNDWPVKEFPDKKMLDELFPRRPVFLKRIDGHAALVNQKALDLAGITPVTKIDGGLIELQAGELTGILFDNAMDVVENKIPLIPDSLALQYFLQAQDSCFQYGLTGVHDCGISEHTVALIDAAQKSGNLKMKIFALLSDSAQYYDRWMQKGIYKTEGLHVGGFKLYADGALGSRGACLLQPYADKPQWNGFLLSEQAHFKEIAQRLAATGFQMCTHAIGDSGNRLMLDVYGAVLKSGNDKRWRIEHAQVVNENDFSLFGKYGIIPSVQPVHATSDMYWAESRLGTKRITNAYAYQQLLVQNGWMPLGTDFPVEDINPFKTFYAAVERKDSKGFPGTGFQKGQALTRRQALLGMTLWAAKAAFEEKEKGSLEPGKTADFIITNQDLLTCEASQLLKTRVQATFVNGKKVFGR